MNLARNKPEALLGIEYRIRLHERHCRFYRRARVTLIIVSAVAGSAVITTVVQSIPGAVATLAGLVAVLAYIEGAINLSALAERHSLWTVQFRRYMARARAMNDVAAIDAGKDELIADTTVEFNSLCEVAFNDALASLGYIDGVRRDAETKMERLMRALA